MRCYEFITELDCGRQSGVNKVKKLIIVFFFGLSHLRNAKLPEACARSDICFTQVASPTNVWNAVTVLHVTQGSFHNLE